MSTQLPPLHAPPDNPSESPPIKAPAIPTSVVQLDEGGSDARISQKHTAQTDDDADPQGLETPKGTRATLGNEVTEAAHGNSNLDDEHVVQHDANEVGNYNTQPTDEDGATHNDVLDQIPAMYRLLDLINDGADKIIIHQPSIDKLANKALPGSYTSISKIDFKSLDQFGIRPHGIYGSKIKITNWLHDQEFISRELAEGLRLNNDTLRPGLYLVQGDSELYYVIFWPEEATWDAKDTTEAGKNRIIFMRYLTKLCDQISCLVSDEDIARIAAAEKWGEDVTQKIRSKNRMYSRKVTKVVDREETAVATPGPTYLVNEQFASMLESPGLLNPPILVTGDANIGIALYRQPRSVESPMGGPQDWARTSFQLREIVSQKPWLSPDIGKAALDILVDHGLCNSIENEYSGWKRDGHARSSAQRRRLSNELSEEKNMIQELAPFLQTTLIDGCIPNWAATFPSLNLDNISGDYNFMGKEGLRDEKNVTEFWAKIQADDPHLTEYISQTQAKLLSPRLSDKQEMRYHTLKQFWISLNECIATKPEASFKWDLLPDILLTSLDNHSLKAKLYAWSKSHDQGGNDSWGQWLFRKAKERFRKPAPSSHRKSKQKTIPEDIGDADFLVAIQANDIPGMEQLENSIRNAAEHALRDILHHAITNAVKKIETSRLDWVHRRQDTAILSEQRRITKSLIESINKALTDPNSSEIRRIYGVQKKSPGHFIVKSRVFKRQVSSPMYHVFRMQFNTPGLASQQPFYRLQLRGPHKLLYMQFVGKDGLLTVTEEGKEVTIRLHDRTRDNRYDPKTFKERIGTRPCFAFETASNLLAVLTKEDKDQQLNLYHFNGLRFLAAATLPLEGYPFDDQPDIALIRFLPKRNMLVMVDDKGQMSLFSLSSNQFRSSGILLNSVPTYIEGTEDGACIIVGTEAPQTGLQLRAYHLDSFGSIPAGIPLKGGDILNGGILGLTKLEHSPDLVLLSYNQSAFSSLSIAITCKADEFSFGGLDSSLEQHSHHPLIHCFSEVWNRYPIAPTIERVTNSEHRKGKVIHFVASAEHAAFVKEFRHQQMNFRRSNPKPVSEPFNTLSITSSYSFDTDLDISRFKLGDWLVGLFCLLPIHLALTAADVFVLMKDGFRSREFEDEITGASVEAVANSLSFGWYESIFNSYLAKLPVRVVSSMGEQSVGKSYALNHLGDTSFAGSAMRCTEGAWMSVTPRSDELLVSMDFEGMNSIERSQQEDMFLVLLQTAISNLVLLRSHSSVSRALAKLLASFQNSAQAFNAEANPNLFRSKLVFIIRDVTDEDTDGTVKEFDDKLAKIVAEEREGNFLSRLHQGDVVIMPWPMMSSPEFYHSFEDINSLLGQQKYTYSSGGEFLSVLKMLMAKIMAMDWSALDKNLGSQRASFIRAHLRAALSHGRMTDDGVKLMLLDTDEVTSADSDDSAVFILPETPIDDDDTLSFTFISNLEGLARLWNDYEHRDQLGEEAYVNGLGDHLRKVTETRIDLVDRWVHGNVKRYEDNSEVQELMSEFRRFTELMRSRVILCKMNCLYCDRKCIETGRHKGPHICNTDHKCHSPCGFTDDHGDELPNCTLPALHEGNHVCDKAIHLCNEPCILVGKGGCVGKCSKPLDHPGEEKHHCGSLKHRCNEPCKLAAARLQQDGSPICQGRCDMDCLQPHGIHCCEKAAYCPFRCQLCSRLCAHRDHLHGLEDDPVHLCGEEHECKYECEMPGKCEVKAEPRKVVKKFDGRHESFNFTLYTQESRQLRCQVKIKPNLLRHEGKHHHGKDFHFCTAQCPQCDYYCTLPYGHPQPEHVTGHGSMKETQWKVENDGEARLEGRRYGTGDSGSTMRCSTVCAKLGRHAHLVPCRSAPNPCQSNSELEHVIGGLSNENGQHIDCDWITHRLFWERIGFKDPYSHEQNLDFAKCDYRCPDPEHTSGDQEYCSLPIFHPPAYKGTAISDGYISHDGHSFECKDPSNLNHIIFVIDRSGSMSSTDKQVQTRLIGTNIIAQSQNNRYGAVLVAVYRFLKAVKATRPSNSNLPKDAFSCILFNDNTMAPFSHDSTSSEDELLSLLVTQSPSGQTDFNGAIKEAMDLMSAEWEQGERPVIIFLSDGESRIHKDTVPKICDRAIQLGKPLAFYTVTFGETKKDGVLRTMAAVASESYRKAEPNALKIPCAYAQALTQTNLEDIFVGIAESLRDNRAALYGGRRAR